MLLTGFDSKYLNTLYVDKNLKHHGLIQAFSRTNRVLNDTKPYGNILDFRSQQDAVDAAIALFSGAKADRAREIWLVDKAPVVIEKLQAGRRRTRRLHEVAGPRSQARSRCTNLKGDDARAASSSTSRKSSGSRPSSTSTPTSPTSSGEQIEQVLPKDDLRAFRGVYLETAQRLKEQQGKPGADGEPTSAEVDQLDFEFVLFASAVIDYDYIMELIAKFSGRTRKKLKMSREQLIGLIQSDAKFLDEREDITEYVRSLKAGEGLDETPSATATSSSRPRRRPRRSPASPRRTAWRPSRLQAFVDSILQPHDLRRRAAHRPDGPARPRLERPHARRNSPSWPTSSRS